MAGRSCPVCPSRVSAPAHGQPGDETGRAAAWYVHVYGAWVLSALVGLHVVAAVFHHVRHRDGYIVRRMGFGDADGVSRIVERRGQRRRSQK